MGADKATLTVRGRPMATTVAEALGGAGCAPVVVVGGDAARLAALGLPWAPDAVVGIGPAGGVLGALEWFAAERPAITWVVVVACDLPDLTAAALAPLLAAVRGADNTPGAAGGVGGVGGIGGIGGVDCVVAHTTRPEPAVAAWRVDARQRIAAEVAAGTRALHRLIAASPTVSVALDGAALRNVNTPVDMPE